MKCVELVGPMKLEVKSRVAPTSKDGSVVFRVNTCGICGSDIHYWDMGAPVGLVMGHEFCGTVIDPGARSDLKVGDRIITGGIQKVVTGNPVRIVDKVVDVSKQASQKKPNVFTRVINKVKRLVKGK